MCVSSRVLRGLRTGCGLCTAPGTFAASACLALPCALHAALALLCLKHTFSTQFLTGGSLHWGLTGGDPVLPRLLACAAGCVPWAESRGDREGGLHYKCRFERIPFLYTLVSPQLRYLWGENPVRWNEENKPKDLKFASCLIPLIVEKKNQFIYWCTARCLM